MLAFLDVIWLGSFFSALVVLTQRIQEARHRRELHASEYIPHARHVQICRPHAHTHTACICPMIRYARAWRRGTCCDAERRGEGTTQKGGNSTDNSLNRYTLKLNCIKTHTESTTQPNGVGSVVTAMHIPRGAARAPGDSRGRRTSESVRECERHVNVRQGYAPRSSQ